MKNCNRYILIGCLLFMAAIVLLPTFGFNVSWTPLLFGVLMIGCCVLPMLFALSRSSARGSSCCGSNKARTSSESGEENEKPKSHSCH